VDHLERDGNKKTQTEKEEREVKHQQWERRSDSFLVSFPADASDRVNTF